MELEGEETNNEAAAPFWVSDRRLSIQIPDIQAFSCSSFCSLQSWPLLLFRYSKLTSFPWLATIRHPVLANTNHYSRATNLLSSSAPMLPSRFHCTNFCFFRFFSGSGSGKPYPKHGSLPLLSSNQRCPQPSPISSLGVILKNHARIYCPFFFFSKPRVCPPWLAAPLTQPSPRIECGWVSCLEGSKKSIYRIFVSSPAVGREEIRICTGHFLCLSLSLRVPSTPLLVG